MLHRSVGELRRTISFDEYLGWLAFYESEPWGQEQATWQLAFIGQQLARLAGRKVSLESLMTGKRPPPRPQTPAEMRAQLRRGAESRR